MHVTLEERDRIRAKIDERYIRDPEDKMQKEQKGIMICG